jgi:hypothetical protein
MTVFFFPQLLGARYALSGYPEVGAMVLRYAQSHHVNLKCLPRRRRRGPIMALLLGAGRPGPRAPRLLAWPPPPPRRGASRRHPQRAARPPPSWHHESGSACRWVSDPCMVYYVYYSTSINPRAADSVKNILQYRQAPTWSSWAFRLSKQRQRCRAGFVQGAGAGAGARGHSQGRRWRRSELCDGGSGNGNGAALALCGALGPWLRPA